MYKPFGELSYGAKLSLMQAWLDGMEIERWVGDGDDYWETVSYPKWYKHTKYRIKVKGVSK